MGMEEKNERREGQEFAWSLRQMRVEGGIGIERGREADGEL